MQVQPERFWGALPSGVEMRGSGSTSSGHSDLGKESGTGWERPQGSAFLQNQSCKSLAGWGEAALRAARTFFIKAKVIKEISSFEWLFCCWVGFFIN